jgi:hypothetical protein
LVVLLLRASLALARMVPVSPVSLALVRMVPVPRTLLALARMVAAQPLAAGMQVRAASKALVLPVAQVLVARVRLSRV